jgi:prepilin-type processing-associated H-X9-DG protein
MKLFICPSDSRSQLVINYGGNLVALTAYLGVSGIDQFGYEGTLYVNSTVSFAGIRDGTSNTVVVGERPPSYDTVYGWWFAGSGDFPYFGATDVVLGTNERRVFGGPAETYRPGSLNDIPDEHRWHYWALHPSGANFLFADGSTRNIPYAASLNVLTALGTRKGGEGVMNDF